MANDLNRCEFIGHLGKEVETRYTPSGTAIASFSIACNESWKDKTSGEKQERVEWINITAFGKLAEICAQYLSKGKQVYIAGKMRTDKYEKDGVTKYSTKIIADQIQMLGGRGQTGEQAGPADKAEKEPAQAGADFNDDIPF